MSLNLPMFYRETAPSDDLARIIFSFWEFRVNLETPEPLLHEVFPDGCVSLVYYRNESFGTKRFLVSPVSLEPVRISVFENDVYWGLRVSPAASAALVGDVLSQNDFVGQLTEKLEACRNFESAITVFETEIRQTKAISVDEAVAIAVQFIEENQAQVKVEEIAAAVNLSRRQFERRFAAAAGLTPKQYLRARRIRATAVNLVENRAEKWANRAAKMGFADQAHLAHEFSALTQSSPGDFAERVKHIEHGKLVK